MTLYVRLREEISKQLPFIWRPVVRFFLHVFLKSFLGEKYSPKFEKNIFRSFSSIWIFAVIIRYYSTKRKENRICPPHLVDYETIDEQKFVDEPWIESRTDNFGIEGSELELKCSFVGISNDAFDFEWQFPIEDTQKVRLASLRQYLNPTFTLGPME